VGFPIGHDILKGRAESCAATCHLCGFRAAGSRTFTLSTGGPDVEQGEAGFVASVGVAFPLNMVTTTNQPTLGGND
jgi:hypothetical protein